MAFHLHIESSYLWPITRSEGALSLKIAENRSSLIQLQVIGYISMSRPSVLDVSTLLEVVNSHALFYTIDEYRATGS
jgi:hypothetical protein